MSVFSGGTIVSSTHCQRLKKLLVLKHHIYDFSTIRILADGLTNINWCNVYYPISYLSFISMSTSCIKYKCFAFSLMEYLFSDSMFVTYLG